MAGGFLTSWASREAPKHYKCVYTHTHTHTHICVCGYRYIYIYIYNMHIIWTRVFIVPLFTDTTNLEIVQISTSVWMDTYIVMYLKDRTLYSNTILKFIIKYWMKELCIFQKKVCANQFLSNIKISKANLSCYKSK